MRHTLLGRLLLVQALVVTLSCAVLVVGSILVGAEVLSREQEHELRALSANFCHDIAQERTEEPMTYESAARETFKESRMKGFRLELISPENSVVAAEGDLPGWVPPSHPPTGTWETARVRASPGTVGSFRVLRRSCARGYSVRVITKDVLSRREVRRAALGIALVMPVAVLAGFVAARISFRRSLRPLHALRDAASNLDAMPGLALGVHADSAELASLEQAFDGLLARLGETIAREKRFAQEASHELRTPLTALRGMLEELKDRGQEKPERIAASGLAEVASLERVVEALLLLARSEHEPVPGTPVNLCDLAREAAQRHARMGGKAGRAPDVTAPDEVLVRGSEDLLGCALRNLLDNARKHARGDEHIWIEVSQENGWATLSVEDDGPGIAADIRPHVFDRFFRGPLQRGTTPGAGLGLAVVRAIVLRHGGQVSTGPSVHGGERILMKVPVLTEDSAPF